MEADNQIHGLQEQLAVERKEKEELNERLAVAEAALIEAQRSNDERLAAQEQSAEERFDDMCSFMKGLLEKLKTANTELHAKVAEQEEQLSEVMRSSRGANISTHLQLKATVRQMEETIAKLHAENAALRLSLPPKPSALKASTCGELEEQQGGEGDEQRAVAAVVGALESSHAVGEATDEVQSSEQGELPAEEAVSAEAEEGVDGAVAADMPAQRLAGASIASLKGGLGLALGLKLDLSKLAPPVVEGERPDDEGRAPPTPTALVLEKIQAKKAAEEAAATAKAAEEVRRTLADAEDATEEAAAAAAAAACEEEEEESEEDILAYFDWDAYAERVSQWRAEMYPNGFKGRVQEWERRGKLSHRQPQPMSHRQGAASYRKVDGDIALGAGAAEDEFVPETEEQAEEAFWRAQWDQWADPTVTDASASDGENKGGADLSTSAKQVPAAEQAEEMSFADAVAGWFKKAF